MDTESTRALVIGLFVVSGQRSLSATELVTLAASRGVSASNLKSHLTRMVADGALARTGEPRSYRYAPGRTRSLVVDSIRARLQPCSETWNGRWVVLAPARARSRDRPRPAPAAPAPAALPRLPPARLGNLRSPGVARGLGAGGGGATRRRVRRRLRDR